MLEDTILGKIVDDKRDTLVHLKAERPLSTFREEVGTSDRDFYTALRAIKPAFILECKKASPSKGLIREPFNLDEIAQAYLPWASAISCLTDTQYFQGCMAYLKQVRDQVTQPVILKDFVIDPYQIYLGRLHGADATLLMLSVLTDDEYNSLADVAHSLGMGVLTEVSTQDELERAIALNAKVIGINNRNLRDLSIDLNRTYELGEQIPSDRIIVSESGINLHQQVRELSRVADAFLVGSSLMSQSDVSIAARQLIIGSHKVCGLTRAEDALAAQGAGAEFGGLIFAEKSPRYISAAQAKDVMAGAALKYVGVFVNEDINTVANLALELGLSAIQLHGSESAQYIAQLRDRVGQNIELWKAHGVTDSIPDLNIAQVDRHLLDSRIGQQTGGTGTQFDWSLLKGIDLSNIMIAGGLNPDNAAQAAALNSAGLDFNSGVESTPGIKDHHKISSAFEALRHY
ncbi:bifunctional indole-3-glycerol-phosphate synthase TrpC/phosphoribosylanthranilate isomerase TrpF [Echinimonas agarilytica]|uniref:Multifunctional fusion protein n=1 Tax=Echinimonas agarilytica TaxID=1215918 RepID=A0AA41W5N5_9GAMM|nr:bifunctional indole-3-glycerol-phosphate synthase TrpC/phosphoribosylanthranilate isomerase TrpF [Echinimonas agarilytica]MCM2679489.1 bifunctional indole-3-glycerol-phosphate synthase TrpC/phosphoribosylanthranilate isomerase TrpF [Echinimonas agarilytica]